MFDRLCIGGAAKRLGVSQDTIRRKIKAKELNANRDNAGRWWVLLPQVEEVDSETVAYAAPMQPPALCKTDNLHNPMQDLHKAYAEALDRQERQYTCLLYTSPSPRDGLLSRMPSSA